MILKKSKKKIKIGNLTLTKTADISLLNDEFVTFNNKNKEYDFSKKNWGYYISPSLNYRLKKNSYDIIIIKNELNRFFLCSVEKNKKKLFFNYLKKTNQNIVCRLTEKFLKDL